MHLTQECDSALLSDLDLDLAHRTLLQHEKRLEVDPGTGDSSDPLRKSASLISGDRTPPQRPGLVLLRQPDSGDGEGMSVGPLGDLWLVSGTEVHSLRFWKKNFRYVPVAGGNSETLSSLPCMHVRCTSH